MSTSFVARVRPYRTMSADRPIRCSSNRSPSFACFASSASSALRNFRISLSPILDLPKPRAPSVLGLAQGYQSLRPLPEGAQVGRVVDPPALPQGRSWRFVRRPPETVPAVGPGPLDPLDEGR